MKDNYDKILELLGYAGVDEDFLIDFDTEIQKIVDKLDTYDLIKECLHIIAYQPNAIRYENGERNKEYGLLVNAIEKGKEITKEQYEMLERVFNEKSTNFRNN